VKGYDVNNDISDDRGARQVKSTVCPLDCADTCSIDVTVENDRVIEVRGGAGNPFTRSKLCSKVVASFPLQVHDNLRVLYPQIKRKTLAGCHFERISWEDAISIIYEKFTATKQQWGGESIAPLFYGGPMGLLAGGTMDKRFFHKLGASTVDATTLCAGTSDAAWESVFGEAGGIDFEEIKHSDLIIVWGNNITTCNLHLTKIIREAKKAGSALIVVDPKRIRIANDADLHVPLLPGTDVAFVYGVIYLLHKRGGLDEAFIANHSVGFDAFLNEARKFSLERTAEICGIESSVIEQFARLIAARRPSAMSIGVAPERNRNGSACVRSALLLMAATGNIGPKGAGVCETSRFFPLGGDHLSRSDLCPAGTREINVMDIPRLIMDPGDETPVKGVFIYNHNPVAVHPDAEAMKQALESDNAFVVGSDISMTDSMLCCDLVLPAPTHFEYGDVYKAYGHRYLQRSEAAISPQGESITNMELFRRLARRFGFQEPCFADEDKDLIQQVYESVPDKALIDQSLERAVDMAQWAEPSMLRDDDRSESTFKIRFYDEHLEKVCGQGVPKYAPLSSTREFILVSPASEKRINSTFGGLSQQSTDLVCEIHPKDALKHGVTDGDLVRLKNSFGEVVLAAKVTSNVRRKTIFVPKGAWLKDSATGMTINALIPSDREPLIGGACYYDCTVDIQLAG